MPDFADHRGTITDLLGGIDAVTEIYTRAGFVRGNHIHHKTTQWTYIVSGRLLMNCGGREHIRVAGDLVEEPAGVPHAWKAIVDCTVLVFTKGPRSGKDYELDTVRLDEALLCE